MASSLPIGQLDKPTCGCDHSNPAIYHEIEQASNQRSSPAEAPSLDSSLLLGRRLAIQWECVNQCSHTEDRPVATTLRNMIDAIERMLRMYEVLLSTIVDAHCRTSRPVFLGSLELDNEERQMVSQQVLRHGIARLGDILKDIEEDSKVLFDISQDGSEQLCSDVGKSQQLMLRLLGRIPKI